jgi:hypothetical protein
MVEPAADTKPQIEKEEYKDLGEYVANITPVEVVKKAQPTASYGHRIRIAKLFDSHEEFMYKIIQVAGWARTVRSGGKDFCFIEISDGSHFKGLQVMYIFQAMSPSFF